MEITEAYNILGLAKEANQEEIAIAYKNLIKKHHPDKSPDSAYSYSLNEARDTLIDYLNSKDNKAVALVVATALSKYREADRKETELRHELNQLINELSKRPKSKIERLRNFSIIATFLGAVFTLVANSSNSLVTLNWQPEKDIQYDSVVLLDQMLRLDSTVNIESLDYSIDFVDSVFRMNQKFKKRFENDLKKIAFEKGWNDRTRKLYEGQIKMMLLFMTSCGVFWIAYIQMRLKAYESNLETFKGRIDNKSKLRKLLRMILNLNNYTKPLIPEYQLQLFIRSVFYGNQKKTELSYELHGAIELGKKLEIEDLEKIMILKLAEKDLIEESNFKDETDETYYAVHL
jgi:hypothetical protein